MLVLARPLWLLAGLLAALIPLALHLIARRPPGRAPLPTARFLEPDARTNVRVRRVPSDLVLLALRMLLVALAGLALAGPAWLPRQEGTAEVVLLDRGAGVRGESWRAAVAEARRRLVARDGAVRGTLVVFDSAAERVPRRLVVSRLDSLAAGLQGSAPSDYAAALRALRSAAADLRGADSVRATLLTRPRRGGWSPGLAAVRAAAWPASVEVPGLPETPVAAPSVAEPASPRGSAVVLARGGAGEYVAAALGATGWRTTRAAPSPALGAEGGAFLVLAPVDGGTAAALRARAEAGATVVLSADAGDGSGLAPWRAAAAGSPGAGEMRFAHGPTLGGAASRAGGGPADGARLLASWEDGRPAVAARRLGRGCVVYVAAPLEGGRMPLSAAYPRVLDRLVHGCDRTTAGEDAPLDAGALALLRGDGLPAAVAASAVAGPGGGVQVGRWVLGAALLAALVETALAYGRRRRA